MKGIFVLKTGCHMAELHSLRVNKQIYQHWKFVFTWQPCARIGFDPRPRHAKKVVTTFAILRSGLWDEYYNGLKGVRINGPVVLVIYPRKSCVITQKLLKAAPNTMQYPFYSFLSLIQTPIWTCCSRYWRRSTWFSHTKCFQLGIKSLLPLLHC